MMKQKTLLVAVGVLWLLSFIPSGFAIEPKFTGLAPAPAGALTLWYRQPAHDWIQALALGNGRLGAMVFGGVNQEHIGLNEDTLWSGGPYDPSVDCPPETLAEIRRLYFAGKNGEAQNLANKLQGKPANQASYQTIGELMLNFPAIDVVENYRRDLDLDTAVASVSYTANGVRFTREIFASPVDQVIVIRLTADTPGQIDFDATFVSPLEGKVAVLAPDSVAITAKNGDMTTRDKKTLLVKAALTFQSRARVLAQGGETKAAGDKVSVTKADSATILIAAATSYKNYHDTTGDPAALCENYLQAVAGKSYDELKRNHIAEHQRLFRRVQLDLGSTAAAQQPTDERIKNFSKQNDPALVAMYFQFGRYLLISCSRPGGQPANLQGLWNRELMAPWDGKYTVNINTEMNYWPAQAGNLAECEAPLFEMVRDVSVTGQRTAERTYHARGWVLHHNTDLWRATAPIDTAYWGQWQVGGAWLCNQLYQRYEFDGDKAYLKRLYPILKGAAQFFLDTLVEEPKHKWLVTAPANSPEHEYARGQTISAGPTMDMAILRELFADCLQASEILDVDADFRRQITSARERLAPNQIGKAGQLQEWLGDLDVDAPEIQHRHMSPLYGLYPGNEITPADPKIFAAARKLTEMRGTSGMGWGQAWRVALWARLLDGERAYSFVENLLTNRTESNLFDRPSVQLDGNFGATAGICEMLLQSRPGEIILLPALPKAWPDGSVKGLRARGGFEVDIAWQQGKLVSAQIKSLNGNPTTLRCDSATLELKLKAGEKSNWDGK